MQETTREDRAKELSALLEAMKTHPERDWTEEKKRVNVLRRMLDPQQEPAA